MRKVGILIPVIIILGILFVGCSKEKNLFTESGLDKIHINKLIVTDEKSKKVTEITNGAPIGEFFDEISSIKPTDNKEENHEGGCNVPGKNKYYIEFQDSDGDIVGDLIIGNEGDLQIDNFKNKYIKIVDDKDAALRLEKIIEEGNI